MVDMASPWFTRPWIRQQDEITSIVGGVSYLGAGLASAILVVVAGGPVSRGLAVLTSAIFIGLGSTLLATLMWRRRNEEGP